MQTKEMITMKANQLIYNYSFWNGETSIKGAKTTNKVIHGNSITTLEFLQNEYDSKVKFAFLDISKAKSTIADFQKNASLQLPEHLLYEKAEHRLRLAAFINIHITLVNQLLHEDGILFMNVREQDSAVVKWLMDRFYSPAHLIVHRSGNSTVAGSNTNCTLIGYAKNSDHYLCEDNQDERIVSLFMNIIREQSKKPFGRRLSRINIEDIKSLELMRSLIDLMKDDYGTVLDVFSGTANSAKALFSLNQRDGGNRNFVCIEPQPYAEFITAKQIKQAINKFYGIYKISNGFDYFEIS